MSFTGGTYNLVFNGKFNGNENVDFVPAGDYVDGSRNLDDHRGGVEKRGGTQVVTSSVGSGPVCLGLGQLVQADETKIRYFVGDDGKIYRITASVTAVKTGLSTTAKAHLTPIGNSMFIANGTDAVQVDTGSAIGDISGPAADWTGSNQPAVIKLHSRGAARRAWAVNVTGFQRTAYYSSLGAFQTFTGGTSGTVNVDIQRGGIITAEELGENLLFFGKSETFFLLDDDTDVATWGVYKAPWTGGVATPRLIAAVNNDLICMMEDGEIYSVNRAQQVRDYKRASIARPHFIHNWIKNNIDLSKINDFHMAYDPVIQALRVWMVRIGQDEADICLKYFPFEDRWGSPDDALENPNESGFHAAASCTATLGSGDERCLTGDYVGVTWKLSDETKTDDGNAYKSVWSGGWLNMDNPRNTKRFVESFLNYVSRGAYTVSVRWYLDGNAQTSSTVDVGGIGGSWGSATYGTSVYAVQGIEEAGVPLGNIGKKVRFEISNDGAGEDFFLSYLLIDFTDMGAKVL